MLQRKFQNDNRSSCTLQGRAQFICLCVMLRNFRHNWTIGRTLTQRKREFSFKYERQHTVSTTSKKTHITESYLCQYCVQSWSTEKARSVHLANGHRIEANYKSLATREYCSICSRSYKHLSSLRRHLLNEHGLPTKHWVRITVNGKNVLLKPIILDWRWLQRFNQWGRERKTEYINKNQHNFQKDQQTKEATKEAKICKLKL